MPKSQIVFSLGLCLGLAWTSALPATDLPWKDAGWTEREAAAHLLDRLTFGPRPGDIDRVIDQGLDAWVEEQLGGTPLDRDLQTRLEDLPSLNLRQKDITNIYRARNQILREAQEAGVLPEDFARPRDRGTEREMGRRERRELFDKVRQFAQDKGYRSQRELYGELVSQKILRAAYAGGLEDVLTDFWFNHFNVSLTENDVRPFITTYERDAIRANVLGSFREMLEDTAKHPAMLLYLDNTRSVANDGATTTLDARRARIGRRARDVRQRRNQRATGLNENYARELLELHTLGVDGGYDQDDVIEVARAFTGWATVPPTLNRRNLETRASRARRLGLGFVFEDEFIFRADVHDAGRKKILGRTLPAGRGMEDGLEVLDLLVEHPSTARHIATKLAVRFVADEPPPSLVDRLARTFSRSGGNLRTMMRTLVEAPEFWEPETRRQKIKSPFELAISAVRAVDAEIDDPAPLAEWISRMGQPLFAYQAPTGYPDRASAWVNTGALLNRMNFGLQFADLRIEGLEFDLAALNQNRQPESAGEALRTYVGLLLPERDPGPTVDQLEPVIRDPEFASKVARSTPTDTDRQLFADQDLDMDEDTGQPSTIPLKDLDDQLAQVVGVILGSPEFQRR